MVKTGMGLGTRSHRSKDDLPVMHLAPSCEIMQVAGSSSWGLFSWAWVSSEYVRAGG